MCTKGRVRMLPARARLTRTFEPGEGSENASAGSSRATLRLMSFCAPLAEPQAKRAKQSATRV